MSEKNSINIAAMREKLEAMLQGSLKLSQPITCGEKTIETLDYDFKNLTGLDYVTAMDSDQNARNAFIMTTRQALALFAAAAAKTMQNIDRRDITEKIGVADAMKAVEYAMVFTRLTSLEEKQSF